MAPQPPLAEILVEDLSSHTPERYGISIRVNQVIKVGRDPMNNNYVFLHPGVSRNHFEIYSVVFEDGQRYPPLVYLRDRQSCNGTYVNGRLVGRGPDITPARLLEDGDKITIEPFWSFHFCQSFNQDHRLLLTGAQWKEVDLFADQYVIKDRVLGEGAYAKIYLAADAKTDEQLVCKVHDLDSVEKRRPSSLRRVEQEAAIWSQLDHPNILPFRRAFRTQHSMYAFAELATGGDLFSLLERETRLQEIEVRWIVKQILHAIAYLHSKGVAHRDIKLENVLCMIGPRVGNRIVLSDFGCCAVVSQGRMTSSVGTPIYQAPECYSISRVHDMSVDIWALGLLSLQLLAGNQAIDLARDPHDTSMLQELVEQVSIDRERHRDEPISADGIDFIRCCLQLDPQARMTATKAEGHPWLNGPAGDQELFAKREYEATKSWTPRKILLPAVVDMRGADVMKAAQACRGDAEIAHTASSSRVGKAPHSGSSEDVGMLQIPESLLRKRPFRAEQPPYTRADKRDKPTGLRPDDGHIRILEELENSDVTCFASPLRSTRVTGLGTHKRVRFPTGT